jgi:ribose-phosphate pyrophosphokinase
METTLKDMEYLHIDADAFNEGALDCHFFKYPDGQQNVRIEVREGFNPLNQVQIVSRFRDFMGLERIVLVTQALKDLGCERISLNIPYLLGARSDRKFFEGGVNYLRDVIATIINAQDYNMVKVYDVHNEEAAKCINNLVVTENHDLVGFALGYLYNPIDDGKYTFVCPDKGARPKMEKLLHDINYQRWVAFCEKERDPETGEITGMKVPSMLHCKDKDFVIVDDICDGGRTFIEIAQNIKEQHPNAKIYLIVSHGIFSKGFKELRKYFTKIFTTDSICDNYAMEFPEMEKGSEIVEIYPNVIS